MINQETLKKLLDMLYYITEVDDYKVEGRITSDKELWSFLRDFDEKIQEKYEIFPVSVSFCLEQKDAHISIGQSMAILQKNRFLRYVNIILKFNVSDNQKGIKEDFIKMVEFYKCHTKPFIQKSNEVFGGKKINN